MIVEHDPIIKIELTPEEACNIFHELESIEFKEWSALRTLYNQLYKITLEIKDIYLYCTMELEREFEKMEDKLGDNEEKE